MPEWFVVTTVVVIYLVILILLMGLTIYLFEEDRILPMIIMGIFALFFGMGVPIWHMSKDDNGYAEWRGGSGSETRCEYVEKTVIVNKIPTQTTYTRCYK